MTGVYGSQTIVMCRLEGSEPALRQVFHSLLACGPPQGFLHPAVRPFAHALPLAFLLLSMLCSEGMLFCDFILSSHADLCSYLEILHLQLRAHIYCTHTRYEILGPRDAETSETEHASQWRWPAGNH